MNRYKVKKPFVDFGLYHAADEIITDVTMINSRDAKLWEGTIVLLQDDGTEVPFDKISHVKKVVTTPSNTKADIPQTTTVTPKVVTAQAKATIK